MNNKNKSILIVESNVRVFESLQKKLKDGGMIVISSKDGFEGYERAKKEMPDIILVEVSVPVMNGLKLCKLIKFDERLRCTPKPENIKIYEDLKSLYSSITMRIRGLHGPDPFELKRGFKSKN